MLPGCLTEGGRDEACGEEGIAEKVIEFGVFKWAGLLRDEECLMCGAIRCTGFAEALGGTWAICAIPFPPRSMLRIVVGFVLAVMLLNVRGSDR